MVTKHITGYKRSVIQKKPKKYTQAYNYVTNQWRQSPTPDLDVARDRKRAAKEPGWRPVYDKNGNVDHYYFERRANRSDTQKQRRTALGLRARDGRYGMRRKGVVIDRQKPKVTLIEPEIPTPTKGGKYFNPAPKNPLTQSQLKSLIKKAELSIHTKPVENLFVFDVKKGIVFTNTNNKESWVRDTVVFKGDEYIITHNHPNKYGNPNPLSGADISCLFYYKRLEIRACSFGHVYRMRRGTADPNKRTYYKGQWTRAIHKAMNDAKASYPEFEYLEGESSAETETRKNKYFKALDAHIWKEADKALEMFCAKHGFWYKKETI